MTDITNCAKHVDCVVTNNHASKNHNGLAKLTQSLFMKIKAYLALRRQRRINRDAMKSLLSLDEATLKDIGVSRDDVLWASTLPAQENASQELGKIRTANIATARWAAMRK